MQGCNKVVTRLRAHSLAYVIVYSDFKFNLEFMTTSTCLVILLRLTKLHVSEAYSSCGHALVSGLSDKKSHFFRAYRYLLTMLNILILVN